MNISAELTLTPIQDDYEPAIIQFITSLRNSGLKVIENPLSTQIYGDYDAVMEVLQKEMKVALDAVDRDCDRCRQECHGERPRLQLVLN